MRPILSLPLLNTVCAMLLSSACTFVLAQDPPARVGPFEAHGQTPALAGMDFRQTVPLVVAKALIPSQ